MKSERRRRKIRKALLFAVLFAALAFVTIGCASAATHYVNPGDSIQAAIDAADPGDTIIVRDGTYSENVNVDKQLTIRSENGSANCIVQAANPDENVFWVAADSVSISGFTATGTTGAYPSYTAGIHLYYADNCSISNNNASNNHHGIYLRSSSNYNTLTNNTVNSNVYGIDLSLSDNNILISNTANSNTYGICLSPGPNTLRNNAMNNNTYNFNFGGMSTNFSAYCHDIDTSNTVDGRPMYYWSYKKDAEISDLNNAGFVALVSCDNITVKNLNVHNNSHGIFLVNTTNSNVLNNTASSNEYGIYLTWYSNNNALTDNTANSNGDGIYLSYSNNNALTNNTLNSNDKGIYLIHSSNNTLTNNAANSNVHGIHLYGSNNNILTNNAANSNGRGIYLRYFSICNTLTNNIVNSNGDGICLDYSNNNTLSNNAANSNTNGICLDYSINNLIYNNYFNNTNNAYAYPHYVGNNIWNITKTEGTNVIDGSYLGGNYWSDYEGEDLNGDGLGDTLLPYNSSGKIQNGGDYLPLVSGGVAPLPPVANFSYTPENPVVNEDITFNASDSFDPDGTIASYEWDFGDGATLNTINSVTMHTYSSSGTYTVTLTVTDDDALTGSTSREIVVSSQEEIYRYRTDFDELDKNYWYVAEWVTLIEAYDKVRIENGTLVIPVEQTDRGPIVFFKPFEVKKGDIVKIKRKALLHYANQYFMGSLGLYQANNDNLTVEPDPALEQWWKAYAQYPVVRVDYLHYYYTPDNKPTTDGFVVRGIDYIIADSIFDQWFEEELIYNTETGEITYILNGQEFKVNGSSLEEDTFLRLAMDSYGWSTGHYAKVDYFEVEVTKSVEGVNFDTGPSENPYPSIMGTHKGEIKPSANINVSKLYTYACAGTGGHTESIKLYEKGGLIASGIWSGYQDDYHNITINPPVTLLAGHTYNYTIVTGSYPQIIHATSKEVTGGTITCTSFVDANGKTYTDWIPAIMLE